MPEAIARLRAKLGDFWFSTLLVFVACRSADVINLFVGLWLVPKFIGPSELGAVMPLTSFATTLALPVTVFTTVFTKEVNALATRGEFGKMKTLIRGVFIFTGIFLVMAIVVARLSMPLFLERIRVENGSLTILVLAAAFVGTVCAIYSNVLQALKRFKAYTFLCVISAPLRFLTMLVAMPYRALSGYFLGQSAGPSFSIFASVFFLRKELSVKSEPYWTNPVIRRFASFFLVLFAYSCIGAIQGLVEQTVLRQRLPDLDSAAYYMATRFSEMSGLLAGTLSLILFPYTSEAAERGESTRPFVIKSSIPTVGFGILLAIFFWIFGKPILAFLPHGEEYANYAWAIPWLILLTALGAIQGFYTNTEISARRFGFLKWRIPLHVISVAVLLLVTGYGYFTNYIPASWSQFLTTHNFTSLKAMLWWMTAQAVIPLVFCTRDLARQT